MSAPIKLPGLAVILFAAILGAVETRAQGQFPPRLTVSEAAERAVAVDPRAKIADSAVKISESGIKEARTGKRPVVQFTQNVVRSNNPVFVFGSRLEQGRFRVSDFALGALNKPDGLFNFRTSISVQQPLFDQRQTRSRVSQAEFEKRRSELQAETVRQQLRFEVVRNYFGVVLAQEMLKVGDEAVRSAEANVKKAKDMAEVGMTTDADFLAAEVEAANAGQQRLEAGSNLTITRAALNIALGQEPALEVELATNITERFFPVESRDDLMRSAFENRADLKRAQVALEVARTKTQGVRDRKLPQISAFGNLGYSSPYIANGSTDYTIGVSLSYNLFDAGRKARVEQAATAESIAASEIDSLSNQIRMDVIRAEQTYLTARAKIVVSAKSIVQAEEALRIIHDRYKFGLTTFNEVIRAESALVRAKHNLLTARYEYYVSYASILLATGRLTDASAF